MPADAALATAYPETGSWPYETTFISNVQIEGDFDGANSAERFMVGADLNGLALLMRDGGCAIRVICVLLNRIVAGYIQDTRIALGSDAPSYSGTNVLNKRRVQDVSFEDRPATGIHSLATGVQVSQSAAKAGVNVFCFATTSYVRLRPGTKHNVLTGGASFGQSTRPPILGHCWRVRQPARVPGVG